VAGLSSNAQPYDDSQERILQRVKELLDKNPQTLPLTSERDAASPTLQRQERLQTGDPYEMSLPPEQPTRYPIGATIGGLVGIGAGAPAGPVGSAVLGGVLSAGGEGVQQLVEHAIESPHAPKTTTEAAKRMGGEALLGGLAELGGRYTGKLFSTIRRKITPEAAEVREFVQQGMPFMGKKLVPEGTQFNELFLTPAELTGGKNYIQTLQNVAEGSFGGKGIIEEFKSNRNQFLRETMDTFVEKLGTELRPDQLGDLIANDINTNFKAARAPARSLYNFISTLTMPKKKPVYALQPTGIKSADGTPQMVKVQVGETLDESTGAWVDIRNLKKSMETDNFVVQTLKGLGAKEGGDDVVSSIRGYPDKIPFFVAQKLRSRLQAMADVFSIENKKAPALGIIKNAAGQVDQAIDHGLNAFSPDVRTAWRYANETYKGANEDFNNEFLRSLLKTIERKKGGMPEEVVNAITMPGKFSDLKRLKTAVAPETWNSIQRSALTRKVEEAMKDGVIQPHKLEQALFGPKGFGQDKMNVLFTQEQQHWMKRFVQAAHATTRTGDTTGKMAIQLAQPGAGMALGASLAFNAPAALPLGASAIVFGPPLLARVLTTPKLTKLLVEGMETPVKSPKAGAVIGRLVNLLVPRTTESTQTPRVMPSPPSTQPDYGGLNLP